ncbi:hypothetical protein Tco_0260964 [Tanacetum coccineum]
MAAKRKTNDESGTHRSQSGWNKFWAKKVTKKINVHLEWVLISSTLNLGKKEAGSSPPSSGKWDAKRKLTMRIVSYPPKHTHSYPHKKDDKEDECASRVVDSSNTNQWGKKEAGSSPPSSGKWAAKRKLMMRVGPLVLSLDGKLLGPRRMTKKINVHPEWKILQTLTNGAKRKLDHLLLHLSGWKTSWAKKDDKEDQCASRVVDSSNTNQWGKKEAGSSPPSSGKWAAKRKLMMRVGPLVLSLDGKLLGPRRMTKKINVHPEWLILQTLTNGAKRKLDHLLLHLVNGLLWKTNDDSGTPRSQSGWKTSWDKKDDKEDQCASRVEDSSNTNQ